MAFSAGESFYLGLLEGVLGRVYKKDKSLAIAIYKDLKERGLMEYEPSLHQDLPAGLYFPGISEEMLLKSKEYAASGPFEPALPTRGVRDMSRVPVRGRVLIKYFQEMFKEGKGTGNVKEFAMKYVKEHRIMGITIPSNLADYPTLDEIIKGGNKSGAMELTAYVLGIDVDSLRVELQKRKNLPRP